MTKDCRETRPLYCKASAELRRVFGRTFSENDLNLATPRNSNIQHKAGAKSIWRILMFRRTLITLCSATALSTATSSIR